MPAGNSINPVELSRCRGIGDRCKVGRSAGMITVRRDAVRTQGRAPKGGGNQRDHEAVGSSSRLEAHAEVVKCDISATANTLKSQDTPNLLSLISNIRAPIRACTHKSGSASAA